MRVLVRAPNWLGDIVMALPVFAAVRAHYASEVLALAGPVAFGPLLGAVPGVDHVVPLRRDLRGGRARRDEATQLRAGAFDAAILLPNSFGSALVARQAGIPERWGLGGRLRGRLLTRAIPRPAARTHQVEAYLALVRGLGIDAVTSEPRLDAIPEMVASGRRLLEAAGVRDDRPLIGMAPGAAYGYAKRWRPDRYARVAERLATESGTVVVLVGSGHDRDAGYAIESSLVSTRVGARGAAVVNLIGRTDLAQLIGLLASCRAFVSSDSGPMHLAAALGVPVTAIFGPTDDRLTAPVGPHDVLTHDVWCRPCFFRDCPIDHRCMTRISEERVFEAVAGHLDAASTSTRTAAR
ncbi:MAG: lipopolysaccharide heptosyltransferase II [Acidobacteria bacterium]|nr:lipopolysaccharide heptosyltransferase II [Acidobacteriota bacterium]